MRLSCICLWGHPRARWQVCAAKGSSLPDDAALGGGHAFDKQVVLCAPIHLTAHIPARRHAQPHTWEYDTRANSCRPPAINARPAHISHPRRRLRLVGRGGTRTHARTAHGGEVEVGRSPAAPFPGRLLPLLASPLRPREHNMRGAPAWASGVPCDVPAEFMRSEELRLQWIRDNSKVMRARARGRGRARGPKISAQPTPLLGNPVAARAPPAPSTAPPPGSPSCADSI